MRLTVEFLEILALSGRTPRQDGRSTTSRPGLGVRVTSSGRKTYLAQYTRAGVRRRIPLGSCSAISLDDAREAVRKIMADVANGRDPALERKAARQAQGGRAGRRAAGRRLVRLRRAIASVATAANGSVLDLAGGLLDADLGVHLRLGAAGMAEAERRRAEAVEADGDSDVARVGADLVDRVEGDPAEAGRLGFGPGEQALGRRRVVGEIAADEAGGNFEPARAGDEDVREFARRRRA